jgi:acyl-CoA thioester hydrolase
MKIEIPERKKLVFEMTMPIRWGDMDSMGHVNNTTYFRYLETARIDWLHTINAVPDPTKEGIVIINAFCNFYKQLEYPGDVRLKMYTSDPARTTFADVGNDGTCGPTRRDLRHRRRTTIWVDFPKQKAIDLPDWMRKIVTP